MKQQKFKKIEICHGPTCGPRGASRIQRKMEEALGADGTEIKARGCCGRCRFSNSIVVDGQIVSKLSPATLEKDFLSAPEAALKKAKDFDGEASAELDTFLASDSLF